MTSTGTAAPTSPSPSGDEVGAGRNPQEWMWPGDVVVACVEGIGSLRHPVVDATPEPSVSSVAVSAIRTKVPPGSP